MYVSVRGWIDVAREQQDAVEAVIAAADKDLYSGRDGIDPSPDDADLSMWIRNYGETGATIVPLPDVAWAKAEAWPIEAHPDQWFAVVDLWTQEEGMSDLSLEATVTESSGEVTVVIHNIRVL
jgi:hypothetical protein